MIKEQNIMAKLNLLLLLLCTLCIQVSGQNLNNQTNNSNETINLIFAKNSFHNLKIEEAKATAQILANHIQNVKKLKNNFNVQIAENDKELLEKCKSGFDMVLLTTEQYFKFHKLIPLNPFTTNYTEGEYGYVYHLIVNKNSGYNDIKELKNGTIYIQAHTNDQAATFWVNKLLRDAKQKPIEKYFSEIIYDSKATNTLLPVFFNKAQACVVTNISLKLMMELNPGIKKQIVILSSSDPIILGFTCLNSDKKNTDTYKALQEILPSLHENEYGKQFLNLFGADKLIRFEESFLNEYNKVIK